jgi:apolipoprotein N-acyltransferase
LTHSLANRLTIKLLATFALGAIAVLGYAPFYLYPVAILSLAGLFYFLQNSNTAGQAAWLGYVFGLGFFGAGVSWIYVSLHDFGGMPFIMAALATFSFCAFLALFHAAATYLAKKSDYLLVAAPLFWVLSEWLRSWIFTGFPWLNAGYSQVPYSPLAGFAPLFGVYGVSLLAAFIASLLAIWLHSSTAANKAKRAKIVAVVVMIWVAGSLLKFVQWTTPVGAPISVALLQGNIPQSMKWQPQAAQQTLDQYFKLVNSSSAQLTVLPETALPVLINQLAPDYLRQLRAKARQNGGDVLVGAVEFENNQYYNSMLSFGSASTQTYRKSHLVPFGEFIPLKGWIGWIYRDWLQMPLSDLSGGGIRQKPLAIAGQQAAINICYEDAFGEEIIRQLPQATLLINASNMAWYGSSWAADQHLQMSQMRALETGRMMLRATNTGATAIIDSGGNILAHAPHFTEAALEGKAQGYAGSTPYVRFGNWPVMIFCFGLLGLLWVRKKK